MLNILKNCKKWLLKSRIIANILIVVDLEQKVPRSATRQINCLLGG